VLLLLDGGLGKTRRVKPPHLSGFVAVAGLGPELVTGLSTTVDDDLREASAPPVSSRGYSLWLTVPPKMYCLGWAREYRTWDGRQRSVARHRNDAWRHRDGCSFRVRTARQSNGSWLNRRVLSAEIAQIIS